MGIVINSAKAKVMLVDDSEDDAFFFGRTLQKSGLNCSVHHLFNGAEAIEFLRNALASDKSELPSVIFLDLKMPVLNGFEVLEWMRTQSFPPEMQVVVLSGSERPDDQARAARLGAKDYLVKPLKTSDLNRLIMEVCEVRGEKGARD